MRTFFLILLVAFTFGCSKKQNNVATIFTNTSSYGFDKVVHDSSITKLQGTWGTNELILANKTTDYFFFPRDVNVHYFGYNIKINPDQTFECFETADCGNGCFTSSKGKYKIIDKNYICFYLEEINRSGECSENSKPNIDLGLYYYYEKEKAIYLLKSNGDLEEDKRNVRYRDLVIAKRKEIESFDNNNLNLFMFNWKQFDSNFISGIKLSIFKEKGKNNVDEDQVVAICMAENNIKDYEILYAYKGNEYSTQAVFLVKMNGEYRYVIYDTRDKPKVSLYNDKEIEQVDKKISEIDRDKTLKSKIFKETNTKKNTVHSKKTITVLKKENEIYKIIYEEYPLDLEHYPIYTRTLYFQNSRCIYKGNQTTFMGEDSRISQEGVYFLNGESSMVANKIIRNDSGIRLQSIDWELQQIDQIMNEVKKQNL
ncbi:hypothetical protein [Flavobacterium sp. FlaQc-48]|uniref:hypothetical protein n=1 Tax=Flavobacterium sp. FlaQc-48 TaxID=3374181 RepID=UPI003757D15E